MTEKSTLDTSYHEELFGFQMSTEDLHNAYVKYMVGCIVAKHNFDFAKKEPSYYDKKHDIHVHWNRGLGTPYKETDSLAFFKIDPNRHIMTLEEFMSPERIKVIDYGEDWEKNGFAQRYNATLDVKPINYI